MTQQPRSRCGGIIVPLITPLRADQSLDEPALRRMVEHVLAGGVHGVFALGTMGEMPSLSRTMRDDVVRIVAETIARRVPLYVGITDPSFEETVANAERYRATGADFLVVLPPYYYPATGDDLRRYFEQLAERTGGPLVLYDIPSLTKSPIPLDVLDALSRDPRIVGYKDSRNDPESLWQTVRRFEARDDFAIMVGIETYLPEAVLGRVTGGPAIAGLVPETDMRGVAGGVTGSANVCPDLVVGVYNAARAGDLGALGPLRRRLDELIGIYKIGSGWGFVAPVKAACECLGLCERHVLPPLQPLGPEDVERVRSVLARVGVGCPRQ